MTRPNWSKIKELSEPPRIDPLAGLAFAEPMSFFSRKRRVS
jgi:hypothetical protein